VEGFNDNRNKEWKDIFYCQIKSGNYIDTPLLAITAATNEDHNFIIKNYVN